MGVAKYTNSPTPGIEYLFSTILVHSPPVLSYPVPYSILRIILQSTSEKCVCCCVMCLFKVNKAFFFQSIATSFSCFL